MWRWGVWDLVRECWGGGGAEGAGHVGLSVGINFGLACNGGNVYVHCNRYSHKRLCGFLVLQLVV